MDQIVDTLMVQVRADTGAFANDVASMRTQLDDPFSKSVDAAGNRLETVLAKAVATGNLSFKSLETAGLSALNSIATSAVKLGLDSLFGGGSSGGGEAGGLLSLIGGLFGAPGRAIGGPVSPGQPYMVGENGPELFVPTAAGSIATGSGAGGSNRTMNIAINVNAPAGASPEMFAQSARQIARAVRASLAQEI